MKTVKSNITEMATALQNSVAELLTKFSSVYFWNTPSPGVTILSTLGDYSWKPLSDDGRKLQSKLLNEYATFHAIVSVMLSNQAPDTRKSFDSFHKTILRTLHQDSHTHYKSVAQALKANQEAFTGILQLIDRSYSQSANVLLVPDTNALISHPRLEEWNFADVNSFTILLVAPILRELDSLKVNHRNEQVRAKAEQIIRQIKEYRRRGSLSSGVTIRSNKITLRSVAVEPKLSDSLPWLDADSQDDRMIAAVIEIMRLNPEAPVAIVTGDINLQNKADLARVPFLEPPSL